MKLIKNIQRFKNFFQLFAGASPAGFSAPEPSPCGSCPYPPLPLYPPRPLINGGNPPRPRPRPLPPRIPIAPKTCATIAIGLFGLARPLPGILILLACTVSYRPLKSESYISKAFLAPFVVTNSK